MTDDARRSWMLDHTELLCGHDTTSGHEDRGLGALRDVLEGLGAEVEVQQVEPGRSNILASWSSTPELLFSTHVDTVPPYLPPRRSGDLLQGRGTCDAKGQAACQLAAIRSLLEQGVTDLAWMGVIGEETDSSGARHAMGWKDRCRSVRAVINGEPTENLLATGQRGTDHVRLVTEGVPAHSGTPELGEDAAWPMLEWLERLRDVQLPADPELGAEIWNLGLLKVGQAINVVPAHAVADILVRSLPGSRFLELARSLAPDGGSAQMIGSTPPDRFPAIEGFEHAIVTFGSDAPRLRQLATGGAVALVGPASGSPTPPTSTSPARI
jgi:acetylornithine deacetylase